VSARVAGCDPGTSSLDVVELHDGAVVAQARFSPDEMRNDPETPVRWLEGAGRSTSSPGRRATALPLVRGRGLHATAAGADDARPPDDADASGVGGSPQWSRRSAAPDCRSFFLPGVPSTCRPCRCTASSTASTWAPPDKVCAVALALNAASGGDVLCLLELGSAFTACVAVERGRIVDGSGGTSGAMGWRSAGAWDGEAAYLPLRR